MEKYEYIKGMIERLHNENRNLLGEGHPNLVRIILDAVEGKEDTDQVVSDFYDGLTHLERDFILNVLKRLGEAQTTTYFELVRMHGLTKRR